MGHQIPPKPEIVVQPQKKMPSLHSESVSIKKETVEHVEDKGDYLMIRKMNSKTNRMN